MSPRRPPCPAPLRLTPLWLRPVAGATFGLAYAAAFALYAASAAPLPVLAPTAEVILISIGETTPQEQPSPSSSVESAPAAAAAAPGMPPIAEPPFTEPPIAEPVTATVPAAASAPASPSIST